jgi:hypothetical protein
VGGLIVIVQGIRHFPLACAMPDYPEFVGLSNAALELLILLWMCIGIMLINLGVLAVYFSGRLGQGDSGARIFFICSGVLYLVRAALEVIYPVRIPAHSHGVLAVIVLTSALFLISVFMAGKRRA